MTQSKTIDRLVWEFDLLVKKHHMGGFGDEDWFCKKVEDLFRSALQQVYQRGHQDGYKEGDEHGQEVGYQAGEDALSSIPSVIKAHQEGVRDTAKIIAGEILTTQTSADMSRGDGVKNVDLTAVEYEAILTRINSKIDRILGGKNEK